jgi:hypothetical protein
MKLPIAQALNAVAAASVLVCLWLAAGALFDGEQEASDQRHFASLTDEAKLNMASQRACGGENSVHDALPDGRLQCRTKRGAKTIIAQAAL